jgi:hypothetical protein
VDALQPTAVQWSGGEAEELIIGNNLSCLAGNLQFLKC